MFLFARIILNISIGFLEVFHFALVSGEGVNSHDPVLDLVGKVLLPRGPLVQHEEAAVGQHIDNLK